MITTATPAHGGIAQSPLLPAYRQLLIAAELSRVGAVRTCDLIRRWGVSYSSVTRDLAKLADRGLCERVHGGAIASVRSNRRTTARRQHS